MCGTCGCGQEDKITFTKPGEQHTHLHTHGDHSHSHAHDHAHPHDHDHSHGHDHDHAHAHSHSHSKEIQLEIDVLSKNNLSAERNRGYFDALQIKALNLVSSPGSGKTSLLEKTIKALKGEFEMFIVEGDQQTTNDADRIKEAGAPVIQVNTGNGCHLDADMVNFAVKQLKPSQNSILFIENVGNLVCPSMFDLGESKRVVIISVTEGEDKPIKYPNMFESSQLCIINKTDLLPYVDFDVAKTKEYALRVNPKLEFIELSVKSGEGMEVWLDWLKKNKQN